LIFAPLADAHYPTWDQRHNASANYWTQPPRIKDMNLDRRGFIGGTLAGCLAAAIDQRVEAAVAPWLINEDVSVIAAITADDFERQYAARSRMSLVELRRYRTVRPCVCGDPSCQGWQSMSHERAREYDYNAQTKLLPEHLW
jgi:hypothetical protein